MSETGPLAIVKQSTLPLAQTKQADGLSIDWIFFARAMVFVMPKFWSYSAGLFIKGITFLFHKRDGLIFYHTNFCVSE